MSLFSENVQNFYFETLRRPKNLITGSQTPQDPLYFALYVWVLNKSVGCNIVLELDFLDVS